ncbi:MAG: type 2 isopentenyl-diphosphate Delta-isomerase [Kiritimatiellia bacterium]|nr:type 2 isopentenyl-diphosphate Delta-isomerase [Kiritimatiellia bacterium]
MSDTTNQRKSEVLEIIRKDPEVDRQGGAFEAIRLRHRALPEMNLSDVDSSLTFLEKKLAFPLLISSMTGGDHEMLRKINRRLAEAAEATGVAMGVGSQRVMFTHPASRSGFQLREAAPTALLFANLGGVQLNYGFELQQAREAVSVLGADGLYFHLNPLQEAIQPEGNTNFTGLAEKIGLLAEQLPVPVLLKEVGAGFSRSDAELALSHGLRIFDVAGTGGTSWSRIENHRRRAFQADDLGLTFQDWGLPTPLALRELAPLRDRATLIASGGIRSGIDMVKAVILGASLCGLAAPFLEAARESTGRVLETIARLKREFQTAQFLLGVRTLDDLRGNESLLL